jgi:succinoglycan biosynthesis transport protein ExoP
MDRQIVNRPYEGQAEPVHFADTPLPYGLPADPSGGLTLGSILSIIRMRWLTFAISLIILMGLSTAVIISLKRNYRSEALVVIEQNKTHVLNLPGIQDAPAVNSDLTVVWSEIQILESDTLARKVVTNLHLQDNPAFADTPSPWAKWVSSIPIPAAFQSDTPVTNAPKSEEQIINETIAKYKERFNAYSDGKSLVIATSFSAPNRELARQILTEHLRLYLTDQTVAKQVVINKADVWFQGQLSQMQNQLRQAEAKEQTLRDSNHLLRTGADAETIAGRQLATVSSQLADARADLARKEARYNEIASLASGGSVDGVSADSSVLSSPLIQRLREQESSTAQVLAEQEQRGYQPGSNVALMSARASLKEVQQRIAREVRRMTTAAANDVQIATGNTQRLEQSVAVLEAQLGTTRGAELTVSQLEREIQADRTLYEDLLSRSRQVAVQREIQTPDARIVSEPTMPLKPSFPRYGLFFATAASFSALLAAGFVVLLEKRSTRPSLGLEEIEAECDLPGLGALPRIRRSQRHVGMAPAPQSHLSAALQTVQNSIVLRNGVRQPQVVAFTSALPGDGKTLVASLYARSVASMGRRVLLLDADLRRSQWARSLFKGQVSSGTIGVLQKKATLKDSILVDPALGFDVLAVEPSGRNDSEFFLQPDRVADLIKEARQLYDVVVIDTPPLAVVDDALSVARLADATVMVIRWGRTPTRFIRAALRRLGLAGANVVGEVLNGVDPRRRGATSVDVDAYRLYTRSYLS